MITKLPLVDGVFYIDNSSMELFTTCPRQAYYYILRRRELNRDKIALDFGGAFHNVLEHRYKTHGTSFLNPDRHSDVLAFAGTQQLNTPEDDYRTNSYLVDAVQHYCQQYPAEPFDLATLQGAPAVEIPFAFPLGEVETTSYGPVKVVWTGRIDIAYLSRDRLGVMDHKTTSIGGAQYFAEFEFSHQMYGYVAASEYIFQREVSEVTINGLICRKPTKTGIEYEFSRHIIPVSRPLLEEWHSDSLCIVSDFLAHCEREYWPKHTKWCVGKYGPCPYRGVCGLPPEHREMALATSEYRDVTWSPLNPRNP